MAFIEARFLDVLIKIKLFFFYLNISHLSLAVTSFLTVFSSALYPLQLTHAVPVYNVMQCLDIKLTLSEKHVCWKYHPRINKPLLHFTSYHSKLVNRGIVNLCSINALRKSRQHAIPFGLKEHSERLIAAGFPESLLVSDDEKVLKKLQAKDSPDQDTARGKQKVAVTRYMHNTAHNLKKVANRVNAKVVFSAPEELSKMCRHTGPFRKRPVGCLKKHCSPFVARAEGVVYQIPRKCSRKYVGQTGRCVNDRLHEQNLRVSGHLDNYLSMHCHGCECKP